MSDYIEQEDIRKYTHENKPVFEQAKDIGSAIDESNKANEYNRERGFSNAVNDISKEVARRVTRNPTSTFTGE